MSIGSVIEIDQRQSPRIQQHYLCTSGPMRMEKTRHKVVMIRVIWYITYSTEQLEAKGSAAVSSAMRYTSKGHRPSAIEPYRTFNKQPTLLPG